MFRSLEEIHYKLNFKNNFMISDKIKAFMVVFTVLFILNYILEKITDYEILEWHSILLISFILALLSRSKNLN